MSDTPIDSVEDDDDCLCQGEIPKDKRIDVLNPVISPNGKHRLVCEMRMHQDCPYHGIKIKDR